MHVATVAALSLLLTVPSLGPGKASPEPEGPSSAKDAVDAARQARALLLQRARAVAEPFLKATSPDDLEGLLAEALDDHDLLGKLEAFDQTFRAQVPLLGSQPLEHEAMTRLLGPALADHLVSPRALDEAHEKVFSLLRAEITVGIQRPNLGLLKVSPEEAAGLPGRVMKLVLDRWKSKLAGATLVAAVFGEKVIRGWRADALHEAVEQGKRATLVLLTGLGVPVPEDIIPASERLDLGALAQREERLQRRLEKAPSFDPADPDASLIFPPAIS